MAEETKDFLVRLNPEIWRKAKIHSIDTGESMNSLINRLMVEFFYQTELKTFDK